MKKDIVDIFKKVSANEGVSFFYTPPLYGKATCHIAFSPKVILKACKKEELDFCLKEIEKHKSSNFISLLINYETGYLFESHLEEYANSKEVIFSALVYDFDNVETISVDDIDFSNLEKMLSINQDLIESFKVDIKKDDYLSNIKIIKDEIAKGNTYQVNYTTKAEFKLKAPIPYFIGSLLFNQSAEFSAFINYDGKYIISNSPELFFSIGEDIISAKPMKGTICRGYNHSADDEMILKLKNSVKDQAENTMILDLLRNDLGRVAHLDSVSTANIHQIEKYESLFQMTSTVNANLNRVDFSSILKEIFPSGSITGAPKISTMKIINRLEKQSRGLYTGSIGFINEQKVKLNVAIRTPIINKLSLKGEIGIGSGIVWDSDGENEFEEVLLKAKYLTAPQKYFEIFETMLVEDGEVFLEDYHIKRLKSAADYFMFLFVESEIKSALNKFIKNVKQEKFILKLKLTKWGNIKIEMRELIESEGEINILLSDECIDSANKFNYFKTTNRHFYDENLNKARSNGYFEMIFLNEKGEITEGCISNLIIEKDSKMFTPSTNSGLLNGCYRKYLIDKDKLWEKDLYLNDLYNSSQIYLCNSVRKLIKVNSLTIPGKKTIKFG